MFLRLQSLRSAAGTFINYSGIIAVGAGALAIAQPWTLAVGAVLMGGLLRFAYVKNKKMLEEGLIEHPDKHHFSPNLKT